MEFCCISCLSELLLNPRLLSGVFQPKCLRIPTNATWYNVTSKQVSRYAEPLSYTAQQICTLAEVWLWSRKASNGGPESTVLRLPVKRWPCQHNEWCTDRTLDHTDWVLFCSFALVVRRMPGYNTQRRGTVRTPPSMVALPKCLNFPASVTLDTISPGWNPRKISSQNFTPS